MLCFNRNRHPTWTQFPYIMGFQQSLWLVTFLPSISFHAWDSHHCYFPYNALTDDSFRATLIISQCQILKEMLTFCYKIMQPSIGSFQPFAVTQTHQYSTQSAGQYFKCQEFCSHPDELLQQPKDKSEAGESQVETHKRTWLDSLGKQ